MIILAIVAYLIIAGIVFGIVYNGYDDIDMLIFSACWGFFVPTYVMIRLLKLFLTLPFRLGKKIKNKLNI
jgi:uncharacterized paraquat-inducible protein A